MPDDHFNLNTTFTTSGFDLTGQQYQTVPPAPPPKVAFLTLNLWNEFRYWQANAYDQNRDMFVEHLKRKVSDPDNVEVNWCDRCSMPTNNDLTDVQGQEVCQTCVSTYVRRCGNCEDPCFPNCEYGGESWCQGCSNEHLRYCDNCGFYYRLDDDDHMHRNTPCECPPPTLEIRLRRVEKKRVIREDTKVVVNLADGHISAVGLNEIRIYLQQWGNRLRSRAAVGDLDSGSEHWISYVKLSTMLDEIGSQWQTTRGNFTKRLTSYAYKAYGLKVDPEVITQVGNIARAQSHGLSTKVSFTRDLNQGRSAFVHTGSCWWSDYNSSRCILKSNGGFAMRTWNNSPRSRATGRAWVLPMNYENGRWVPTFDTLTPTGFVVFNGYGDLEDYAPARIMAEITGLPYRKINFDDDEMYVNNESGYLLAPDDYTTGSINLELPRHATIYTEKEKAHA